ncbi:MAG: FAD-dependent oxidoreductase [Polyangiaceae bacterium]|nr:FAD-dependent oxidoreductase [Myxococcales bacterium]MCB9586701.1 FAD-dependent oxidoreductase [Polyangiaceae bacterium]MCB9606208.1 FAD-dependent oxidoreductase [Polyangiaceae bacterium]
MSEHQLGSEERPLRVAVVGAGPAGFYAAEALLKHKELKIEVDLFERLPFPFGLVRFGVAPDHQKIKTAAGAYERTAEMPGFRFLGNVELGRDVSFEELRGCYHQVVITTGAAGDRKMRIPGEELSGSLPATEFVGWYNGHPDFQGLKLDLSGERAVVVGVGDVTTDVVRLLLRSREELGKTDITAASLAVLRQSQIREVVVLGRRGPEQLKMAVKELKGIAEDPEISVSIDAAELAEARKRVDAAKDRYDSATHKRLDLLEAISKGEVGAPGRRGTMRLEFLRSPKALEGDGKVERCIIEKNRLEPAGDDFKARGTGELETLETNLVLRSIGYVGTPLEGLPFDERNNVIPNDEGRVVLDGEPLCGVYVSGWIKRGATGVIGTNRADSVATVHTMLSDVMNARQGEHCLAPGAADQTHSADRIDALLKERGVRVVSWADWQRLDQHELDAGKQSGKVREKLVDVAEALRHIS